jgi:hypothetical protein
MFFAQRALILEREDAEAPDHGDICSSRKGVEPGRWDVSCLGPHQHFRGNFHGADRAGIGALAALPVFAAVLLALILVTGSGRGSGGARNLDDHAPVRARGRAFEEV